MSSIPQETAHQMFIQYQMLCMKICTKIKLYKLNRLCLEIYVYIHIVIINEKVHKFEREYRGLYRMDWDGEREGEM